MRSLAPGSPLLEAELIKFAGPSLIWGLSRDVSEFARSRLAGLGYGEEAASVRVGSPGFGLSWVRLLMHPNLPVHVVGGLAR